MTEKPPRRLDDGSILHFPWPGSGADGQCHILALNIRIGTLAHLMSDASSAPALLWEDQFARSEMSVLRPLLENYPNYCPHEVMVAHFYNGTVNEKTLARARERLQEAHVAGIWDHEMRPVRNVLSRTRLKLKEFGMDVLSILETGYMLVVKEDKE